MTSQATEYLEAYAEYSKVLRTWFVAYGIGAPVLLLTNDVLSKALRASGCARFVAGSFLAGVLLQVVVASFNKASMWALYYGETQPSFKVSRWYRAGYWFSEAFWIDLTVDLLTMMLFGLATWTAFDVLVITS